MLFVTLIAIIATRSRAGTMLSLPLLFLCLGIIFAMAQHHRRTARMLAVLGSGFALLVLFGEPVFSRLDGATQDPRWCAWASTLLGIIDHPWAGTGFATFIEAFPAYRDPECLGTEGTWHRAHNSFLELAFGIGLPATALLLALGYRLLLKSCFTGLRQRKSLRAIPVLTLGALVFVSAHSLADFPLQIPGVAYYFASLMGAGCAIALQERRASRE
jgi:O-antigen ligase